MIVNYFSLIEVIIKISKFMDWIIDWKNMYHIVNKIKFDDGLNRAVVPGHYFYFSVYNYFNIFDAPDGREPAMETNKIFEILFNGYDRRVNKILIILDSEYWKYCSMPERKKKLPRNALSKLINKSFGKLNSEDIKFYFMKGGKNIRSSFDFKRRRELYERSEEIRQRLYKDLYENIYDIVSLAIKYCRSKFKTFAIWPKSIIIGFYAPPQRLLTRRMISILKKYNYYDPEHHKYT